MTEMCALLYKLDYQTVTQQVKKWAENAIPERSFSNTNQSERRNKPITWGYSHDKTGGVN